MGLNPPHPDPLPAGRGNLRQWSWIFKVSLLIVVMFVLAERWSQAFANDVTTQPGDPERGRQIVLNRDKGDCVICHAMPLPGRESHGTIGIPLDGVGERYSATCAAVASG